jgi:hypothetical protein
MKLPLLALALSVLALLLALLPACHRAPRLYPAVIVTDRDGALVYDTLTPSRERDKGNRHKGTEGVSRFKPDGTRASPAPCEEGEVSSFKFQVLNCHE